MKFAHAPDIRDMDIPEEHVVGTTCPANGSNGLSSLLDPTLSKGCSLRTKYPEARRSSSCKKRGHTILQPICIFGIVSFSCGHKAEDSGFGATLEVVRWSSAQTGSTRREPKSVGYGTLHLDLCHRSTTSALSLLDLTARGQWRSGATVLSSLADLRSCWHQFALLFGKACRCSFAS